MRISDWSSDVCSSDLKVAEAAAVRKELGNKVLHHVTVDQVRGVTGFHPPLRPRIIPPSRSEARRVGNECASPCSYRWSPYHSTKNTIPKTTKPVASRQHSTKIHLTISRHLPYR